MKRETTSNTQALWATGIRPAREEELATVMAIDDEASVLFTEAGLSMAHLQPQHSFVQREQERWAEAINDGRLFVACGPGTTPVGFVSLGNVDDAAHLDQLAVAPAWMRQGVGRALVRHALRWSSGHDTLWLTTYNHIAWNRPYYERLGFSVVPEQACGPQLRAILLQERDALPAPEQRVAMRLTRGRGAFFPGSLGDVF